ncbi:MAG: argininosuccinate lyase [Nitriliruptorales bacterium]|nr:argininosuccinate lyase [Nitriliruptorales bacterium]
MSREGRLWGARFSAGPAASAWALGVSTSFDVALAAQDIAGSAVHAEELHRLGIVDDEELEQLHAALAEARVLFAQGSFPIEDTDEDVHGAIERWLVDQLGPLGGKLRAGRSRNDQIANDLRLWLRDAIDLIADSIRELQEVICDVAADHVDTVAPGLTHLQRGQPVVLAHHLLAWFWMLERDHGRFLDARERLNESVLGSGAMAGVTLDLDPEAYADGLGFDRVAPNSMDAVSSRDFAAEFLAAAAICGVTLSRIGEELVLWASSEFGFVTIGDEYSTGSSIMPQKRNPDIAELTRGKSGRLVGNLVGMLTVLKGLPLTYNRDLQEDKEPTLDSAQTLLTVLPAVAGMIGSLTFDTGRLAAAAGGGHALATDLAEELVRRGVPFREAHEVVGQLVTMADERGVDIADLDGETIAQAHEALDAGVATLLDVDQAIARRSSSLGTAPAAVRAQLDRARTILQG